MRRTSVREFGDSIEGDPEGIGGGGGGGGGGGN